MRLRFISHDRVASRNSIATNDGNSLRRRRDNGTDRKTVSDEISRDLFISNEINVLPCKHPVHLIIARPSEALARLTIAESQHQRGARITQMVNTTSLCRNQVREGSVTPKNNESVDALSRVTHELYRLVCRRWSVSNPAHGHRFSRAVGRDQSQHIARPRRCVLI